MHGFCGAWGVLALAIFSKDIGLIYGDSNSGRLLANQLLGIVCIVGWSGTLSALFFFTANKLNLLRLTAE